MHKFTKAIWSVVALLLLFCLGVLLADKHQLRNGLVRVQIIANSDSDIEQQIKFAVRDDVLEYFEEITLETVKDQKAAINLLDAHLLDIEKIANETLKRLNSNQHAKVTLSSEYVQSHSNEMFSLPSGIYDTLKIVIGSGKGEHYWCIAFPKLYQAENVDAFRSEAVYAGLQDELVYALTGEKAHNIRFWVLDCFGKIENLFAWDEYVL